MSATEDRRAQVLRAIVADYISSQEPVGSKALVDRHNLGVSSATIRNDMAVLEDEGFITQPHTSSGRVPTEKGYRQFVDAIHELKPLSRAETHAIQSFLEEAVDLDDVLRRAVRLLAQLTQQVAVIQYPILGQATVRHLEVVDLTPSRLLLVVITDTGRVEQRVVDMGRPVSADDISALRTLLGQAVSGKRLADASSDLAEAAAEAPDYIRTAAVQASSVLIETLVEQPETRLMLGGTANLTRNAGSFDGSLQRVLEALEEQVILLKLLAASRDLAAGPGRISVQIGEETNAEDLRGTAVVASQYGPEGSALGGMGVLGPTRMDYPGTMASVAAVARYVGQMLSER
ncbi:MAG TPA: heat-inducible transcriptional repressor HrcA [Dietzia timorensis]|uniref:Heat-inducible transcription repressor HrcA n=1 Tax=Dietzia timorensis TaxID=499555 RepID=A0A921JWW3_9ACTN|nr:heat-inducible transcriptional repressor HrcA [Dietzia timorensis]HJE89645.1 heat-inducible transcriptional repressor HrcA [Dietzia timorensis]